MANLISNDFTGTNADERKFIDFAVKYLPDDYIIYHNREINGRESDCIILIPGVGVLVVEIKGWIDTGNISIVNGDTVKINTPGGAFYENPKRQSRAYRFDILNFIKKKTGLSPLVFDMVAYPNLSKSSFEKLSLDSISSDDFTFTEEDLFSGESFIGKLQKAYSVSRNWGKSYGISDNELKAIRSAFEPKYKDTPVNNDDTHETESKTAGYTLSGFYSIAMTVKESISPGEIKEIFANYANGTKYFLFVKSESLFLQFKENYLKRYEHAKNLEVSENSNNKSSFIAFNFQIFCVEHSGFADDIDFCIVDGQNISLDLKNLFIRLNIETDFNFNQYFAEHVDINKNLMVMASAGTGKTYSMISRISFICHKMNYSHTDLKNSVCMLTFTNEAAGTMREKLKKHFLNYYTLTGNKNYLLMLESVNDMDISTIHSHALNMLKKYGSTIGFGKNVSVASGIFERRNILEETIDKCLADILDKNENALAKIDISFYQLKKSLLEMITRLYSKNIDIAKFTDIDFGIPESGDAVLHEIVKSVIVETEREFLDRLKESNKIHLSHLMVRFNELSENIKINKNSYKIDFMLIDEFQDTDDTQIQSLIAMQKIMGFKLFVVGDIKQCIYRFRGATTSSFDFLVKCVGQKNWSKISLNKNYRTNNLLLENYNRFCERWSVGYNSPGLLSYAKERDRLVSKKYFNDSKEDFYKRILNHMGTSIFAETSDLVKWWINEIQQDIESNYFINKEQRTIAILVRKNYQARAIKTEMEKYGVNVKIKTGGTLYQSKPAKDFYKLLCALIHHKEPEYLAAFIASGYTEIKFSKKVLKSLHYKEKINYLTSLLDEYFLRNSPDLKLSFSELVIRLKSESVLKIIRTIIEICKPWQCERNNPESAEEYRNNLNLILENIISRYSTEYLSLNLLWQFMNISIFTGVEEKEYESEDDGNISVICMTVHKAKGLEFGYVVVPFTNLPVNYINTKKADVSVEREKIGYFIPIESSGNPHNNSIKNSYYDLLTESKERSMEETRLLYVAATRAIKKFAWVSKSDSENIITWDFLLKEGLQNEF